MAAKKSFPTLVMDVLSSYAVSVITLGFLFLLTLLGTWEQQFSGLHAVQKQYFESWFFIGRFRFTAGGFEIPAIPLPGGVLCMSVLTLNMICGGLVRIRKRSSTAGVIVIHVGMLVMLAAGLVKLTNSEDGHLTLFPGESSDEFVHYYDWEIAVFDAGQQVSVEERIITHEEITDLVDGKTRTFVFEDLGAELELAHFCANGRPMRKGPMWHSPFPTVDGYAVRDLGWNAEAAERNTATVYATARVNGEESRGILYAFERYPWTFEAGGRHYAVALRHRRMQMPFKVTLNKFTRELHPNTGIAKVYASDITKMEDRQAQKMRISMNEPLRHAGLVLFQSSFGPADAEEGETLYSVFSVVRNPSDSWPLWSCIIISIGLLMSFGEKLYRYVRQQNAARAKLAAAGE